MVTELRDTKATHKKELERINKAIKEFEQSFWGYIQSRRPPVDEPDTMSIKVTSTFINKKMQALKASVLEGK